MIWGFYSGLKAAPGCCLRGLAVIGPDDFMCWKLSSHCDDRVGYLRGRRVLGHCRYALRVPLGTPGNPRSFSPASGFSCDLSYTFPH